MNFTAKTRACLFMKDCAEEAASFYVKTLPDSTIENIVRQAPDGPALVVEFTLAGTPYMAMNGNSSFQSSHAFSISVLTEDQAETDHLWSTLLTDGGQESRCGWLVDRFGVHWQVVPKALPRLMSSSAEQATRVQAALMQMNKIDIATLERAARS